MGTARAQPSASQTNDSEVTCLICGLVGDYGGDIYVRLRLDDEIHCKTDGTVARFRPNIVIFTPHTRRRFQHYSPLVTYGDVRPHCTFSVKVLIAEWEGRRGSHWHVDLVRGGPCWRHRKALRVRVGRGRVSIRINRCAFPSPCPLAATPPLLSSAPRPVAKCLTLAEGSALVSASATMSSVGQYTSLRRSEPSAQMLSESSSCYHLTSRRCNPKKENSQRYLWHVTSCFIHVTSCGPSTSFCSFLHVDVSRILIRHHRQYQSL